MANRNASSVLFGYDFQTNAAIVLMLENIKEMQTIRMEGLEDIEINLNDGSCVLAQAKAVVNSSSDFSNVISNLTKALMSLSEAEHKGELVKDLIYITNTPNPFNEKQLNAIFYGPAHRGYNTLPQQLKDKVSEIVSKFDQPLDVNKFKIQILPFETDDETERYKCVMNVISDFISQLGGISVDKIMLHKIWKSDILSSGSKNRTEIKLTKKDIIWPLIVLVTNNDNYEDEDIDDSEREEICRSYKSIISTCAERYEFVTKVLYEFNNFQKNTRYGERKRNFIQKESIKFTYIFGDNEMLPDLKEKLLKIIIQNILSKRIQINNIKNAVNL